MLDPVLARGKEGCRRLMSNGDGGRGAWLRELGSALDVLDHDAVVEQQGGENGAQGKGKEVAHSQRQGMTWALQGVRAGLLW